MSWSVADRGVIPNPQQEDPNPQQEEGVVTIASNGLATKIERIDPVTGARTELLAEEYAALTAGYYAAYYAGIRDYAQAVASGNAAAVQVYYEGMTKFLGSIG
jgi:spermidine/putrescine-binding protein